MCDQGGLGTVRDWSTPVGGWCDALALAHTVQARQTSICSMKGQMIYLFNRVDRQNVNCDLNGELETEHCRE